MTSLAHVYNHNKLNWFVVVINKLNKLRPESMVVWTKAIKLEQLSYSEEQIP